MQGTHFSSNTVRILLQPHHLRTERWFIGNCWSRGRGTADETRIQSALETKEIPSQQHPPTCMPHLRLWTGHSMPCILSNPRAWKPLLVNMHLANTSKQSHTKINREDKQPFFFWHTQGYLYMLSKDTAVCTFIKPFFSPPLLEMNHVFSVIPRKKGYGECASSLKSKKAFPKIEKLPLNPLQPRFTPWRKQLSLGD